MRLRGCPAAQSRLYRKETERKEIRDTPPQALLHVRRQLKQRGIIYSGATFTRGDGVVAAFDASYNAQFSRNDFVSDRSEPQQQQFPRLISARPPPPPLPPKR